MKSSTATTDKSNYVWNEKVEFELIDEVDFIYFTLHDKEAFMNSFMGMFEIDVTTLMIDTPITKWFLLRDKTNTFKASGFNLKSPGRKSSGFDDFSRSKSARDSQSSSPRSRSSFLNNFLSPRSSPKTIQKAVRKKTYLSSENSLNNSPNSKLDPISTTKSCEELGLEESKTDSPRTDSLGFSPKKSDSPKSVFESSSPRNSLEKRSSFEKNRSFEKRSSLNKKTASNPKIEDKRMDSLSFNLNLKNIDKSDSKSEKKLPHLKLDSLPLSSRSSTANVISPRVKDCGSIKLSIKYNATHFLFYI